MTIIKTTAANGIGPCCPLAGVHQIRQDPSFPTRTSIANSIVVEEHRGECQFTAKLALAVDSASSLGLSLCEGILLGGNKPLAERLWRQVFNPSSLP